AAPACNGGSSRGGDDRRNVRNAPSDGAGADRGSTQHAACSTRCRAIHNQTGHRNLPITNCDDHRGSSRRRERGHDLRRQASGGSMNLKRITLICIALLVATGSLYAEPANDAKAVTVRSFTFKYKDPNRAAAIIKPLMSSE